VADARLYIRNNLISASGPLHTFERFVVSLLFFENPFSLSLLFLTKCNFVWRIDVFCITLLFSEVFERGDVLRNTISDAFLVSARSEGIV
jgi:hypothetical protein